MFGKNDKYLEIDFHDINGNVVVNEKLKRGWVDVNKPITLEELKVLEEKLPETVILQEYQNKVIELNSNGAIVVAYTKGVYNIHHKSLLYYTKLTDLEQQQTFYYANLSRICRVTGTLITWTQL